MWCGVVAFLLVGIIVGRGGVGCGWFGFRYRSWFGCLVFGVGSLLFCLVGLCGFVLFFICIIGCLCCLCCVVVLVWIVLGRWFVYFNVGWFVLVFVGVLVLVVMDWFGRLWWFVGLFWCLNVLFWGWLPFLFVLGLVVVGAVVVVVVVSCLGFWLFDVVWRVIWVCSC